MDTASGGEYIHFMIFTAFILVFAVLAAPVTAVHPDIQSHSLETIHCPVVGYTTSETATAPRGAGHSIAIQRQAQSQVTPNGE